jgi:hypothetical protein
LQKKIIEFQREEVVLRKKLKIMQLNLQKLLQNKLKYLELGSLKSKIQELKDVKVVG